MGDECGCVSASLDVSVWSGSEHDAFVVRGRCRRLIRSAVRKQVLVLLVPYPCQSARCMPGTARTARVANQNLHGAWLGLNPARLPKGGVECDSGNGRRVSREVADETANSRHVCITAYDLHVLFQKSAFFVAVLKTIHCKMHTSRPGPYRRLHSYSR